MGPVANRIIVTLHSTHAEGIAESHRWSIVCKLSIGIARGLDHLHTGLDKPMVHGNLKTSNVLLDAGSYDECRVSDYGLHLLLSPAAAQEALEAAAAQGYVAPELAKTRDATRESDVYSLGVVLLELLAPAPSGGDGDGDGILLPASSSFKNLVLERKISDAFGSSGLARQCRSGAGKERSLGAFFELATACCSPSPSLRPSARQVLQRLQEIAR